jgi:hypothetical protein
MNAFDTWMMKRIAKKQVEQGYHHSEKITEMYRVINQAAREEFNEDSESSLKGYLTEWFEHSLIDIR